MFQFFAVKPATAYGDMLGGGTITDADDTMIEGAISLIDQEGTLIPLGAPLAATVEKATILLGRPVGESQKLSSIINRDGIISYNTQQYVAPQKRVIEIGADTAATAGASFNLPATIAIGDSFGVWITDKSIPVEKPNRLKYWEVVADNVLTTGALLATALINKINAAAALGNCPVIAAEVALVPGTPVGITFTAHDFNHDVEVKPAGIIINATYTALTAHIEAEGTAAKLLPFEKDASVEDGNRNAYDETVGSFTASSMLVAGETYDVIILNVINPEQRAFQMGNGLTLEIMIAIPVSLRAAITTPLIANIISNL